MILNVEGEHGDGIRYEGSGRHDFCSCSCVHSLLANEVGILSSVQYRSHAAYLVKHFQTNVLVCSTVQLPAASPGHRYRRHHGVDFASTVDGDFVWLRPGGHR
jgi:hypothetical protein